jgi:hypothetical protein
MLLPSLFFPAPYHSSNLSFRFAFVHISSRLFYFLFLLLCSFLLHMSLPLFFLFNFYIFYSFRFIRPLFLYLTVILPSFVPSPLPETVRIRGTLRLAVYSQLVRLGAKPLEDHDQSSFFPNEPLRS